MSLLTEASLIVTPNAYKEDILYSVIPTDGSGDMDVVRATTATRVNSDGLIEVVPYNLLTYSNTFSNASWFKNNTTITTSQAGYDETNNASLLVENSTASTHFIGKTPSLSGQITISVYAKANTRNWLYLRGVQAGVPVFGWFNLSDGTLGTIQTNGTGSIESVGNGWYRCSLTIANFNTGFETYIGISTANNTISYLGNESSVFIQNAQVNSGASAKEYFPTTDRLNVPRLDYSNGGCPSILVEPQRTNLLLRSEEFNTTNWAKTNSFVTANNTIAPDGNLTADLITATATNGYLYPTNTNIFSFAGGTQRAYSVFLKAGTATSVRLIISTSAFQYFSSTFNLSSGTATADSANTNVFIENYGNGWYRCTISATIASASSSQLQIGRVANGLNFYIWGAQLEAGSYATSYIPTTSASVTRTADVISKTGISNLIGQTEGTVYAEIAPLTIDSTSRDIEISDGNNNRVIIQFNNTGIGGFVIVGGSTQAALSFNNSDTNFKKVILRYKVNDFALFVNGVKVAFDTSGITFPENTLTRLDFKKFTPSSLEYYGKVKGLFLYKTALTDQECINLTTI